MSSPTTTQLRLLIHCTKMSTGEYSNYPHLLQASIHPFSIFEKFKKENGVQMSDNNDALPVIISIENGLSFDINSITFQIIAEVHYVEKQKSKLIVDFVKPDVIAANQTWHDILFDVSGFSQVLLRIENINYNNNNNDRGSIRLNQFVTNTPQLIIPAEIQSNYGGFRDQNEMKTHFLLRNYSSNSFLTRGWLLKLMLSKLKEITDTKKTNLDEKTIYLDEKSLPIFQSIIQIDIISKIMMYIEDLIILSEAMLVNDGDYYELLDRHEPESVDLGDRIGIFLQRFTDNEISEDQYKKILSYLTPAELENLDKRCRDIIARLVKSNIESFKNMLIMVGNFRRSHSQVFRRYKHASFPMKLGYTANIPLPYTTTRFDFYSIIFTGKNPLTDVLPLPYSPRVIESYRNLIIDLQFIIQHIILNKLDCITRCVSGIIPADEIIDPQRDQPVNMLSQNDLSEMTNCVSHFFEQHPVRARNPYFNFEITNIDRNDLLWYIQLDKLLDENKKKQKLAHSLEKDN